MRFMLRSKSTARNPQFDLGLLMLATGLVITLQNPAAVDSASRLLSATDLPSPAHVLEWRPDSPPPWLDGDQTVSEEVEEIPVLTTTSRESEPAVDPRERPQR